MEIKTDCRFYLGDRPCCFHKIHLVECEDCSFYQAAPERVLIVKLGAAGDVVRTTPLLMPLKERHPEALFYWVTDFPELVPREVDRILTMDARDLLVLQSTPWRSIYNLDKAPEACALAALLPAQEKYGFTMQNGVPVPINDLSRHKWLTGLSDPLNQLNTQSYMEEIFSICGFQYRKEPYIVERDSTPPSLRLKEGVPVVGLNTGCGKRWPSRMWPIHHWRNLIQDLNHLGLQVLLLGGPDEDLMNQQLAKGLGVLYPGHFPLKNFTGVVDACDLVVTGVTLALHIALGLKKKVVLLNNIFNRYEFELFGLGKILEPEVPCLGCFKSSCATDCMALVSPQQVLDAMEELLQPLEWQAVSSSRKVSPYAITNINSEPPLSGIFASDVMEDYLTGVQNKKNPESTERQDASQSAKKSKLEMPSRPVPGPS
jgi:ADP-heptose:LPS heptosyltransferase